MTQPLVGVQEGLLACSASPRRRCFILSRMSNVNLEKKQEVDQIMTTYSTKMADILQRRDQVIQTFLEKVRQRRIQEIKNSLSKHDVS